jgi:uncharacterized membrane protein
MYNRPWFKQLAREQVKANLGTLALQILLVMVIGGVIGGTISVIALFAGIFSEYVYHDDVFIAIPIFIMEIVLLALTAPMQLSIARIYLDMTEGKTPKVSDIFWGYSSGQKIFASIKLYFLLFIHVFLWMLLLIVPGILRAIDYSQSFFILADNTEKRASDCIRESIEITRGHRADLFIMNLSFFLWMLLAYIPVIGWIAVTFYVTPYMQSSLANSYRFLKDEANPGYYNDDVPRGYGY